MPSRRVAINDLILRAGRSFEQADGATAFVASIGSTRLQNLVDNLYKGTTNPNRVGNSTTMDAIRQELATGAPTGGRAHVTKGQGILRSLDNWLRHNPNAEYYDRLVAQSRADELSTALRGVR